MGSSPLLRKLLLSILVLMIVALGSAAFLIERYTAAHELAHAQQLLEGQIRILGNGLQYRSPSTIRAWTDTVGELSHARVTVIDRSGHVLADSQHDSSTMDNHAGRPEVREALAGRTGMAVRHSDTLDVDLCYVAVPASLAGGAGIVLRLAIPLHQVQKAIGQIRWLILQSSLIALLAALILGYLMSRIASRRVRRVQAYAHELVHAQYSGAMAPEPDDELGSVARSLRDMAEQFRHILRRLSDESALRKAVLSSMLEGVVAVDSTLHLGFCNSSFARAVNAREPLPDGIALHDVVRDPQLLELLKTVIATRQPARMRIALVGADGRVFEVQAAPIADEPGMGAVAILHEITKVEQLERVRKDFVANISHDLRTPLAAIQGYTETLLSDGSDDQEANRRFLQIIRTNAVRLGDLAADLLTLSELETESQPPPDERISLRETANTAVRRVEEEAGTRQVNIVLREGPDAEILGPPMRFELAVGNLLRNAIRFNRPGGQVYVETAVAGDTAQITFRDTGIGIPSADLPRIFERSYCVDTARSRENGGTGLGLAIVKHIVAAMRGKIEVESQLGRGTKFTLKFPTALPGRPAAAENS
jgi:two-component system phosphate regulon sensor histidine kinase PhoR